MNRIESKNGYTIYQAGARDVKKYGFAESSFYVYFSSDVRELGIVNSTPDFEDCGSIEEARAHCTGNYAIAKEIVEGRTTAASSEEILEVEAQLDAGIEVDDIETAYEYIERPADLPAELPWSGRPYDSDDPLDPYVYEGSMTPEDYELMHRHIAAAEALGLPTDPEQLRARLMEILEPVIEAFKKVWEALREAFAAFADYIKSIAPLSPRYTQAAAAHPRWYHLSKHARKRRTRKKWDNALWREALRGYGLGATP